MLAGLKDVLRNARAQHYAVPAFDCVEDILIRTILDTTEAHNSPVILMVLEHDLKGRGIDYIASMVKGVAGNYKQPVVLHLDHASSMESVRRAIDYGFTSVMFDASMMSFEENVAYTKAVVEYAHAKGVDVEAELGHVAGKNLDGTETTGTLLTEPGEVLDFVNKTQVDALAVSIGTSHGVYAATPNLNIARLKEINQISPVPLVLHGGSGTPVGQVQEAIVNGIAKVNLYADLRVALLKGLKEAVLKQTRIDPLPDELFQLTKASLESVIVEKIEMTYSGDRI
jgi:fructose-bisphosphate aldolase class II